MRPSFSGKPDIVTTCSIYPRGASAPARRIAIARASTYASGRCAAHGLLQRDVFPIMDTARSAPEATPRIDMVELCFISMASPGRGRSGLPTHMVLSINIRSQLAPVAEVPRPRCTRPAIHNTRCARVDTCYRRLPCACVRWDPLLRPLVSRALSSTRSVKAIRVTRSAHRG